MRECEGVGAQWMLDLERLAMKLSLADWHLARKLGEAGEAGPEGRRLLPHWWC